MIRYLPILLLAGCQLCPTKVVTETEYVVKQAPPEMYQLDKPVTDVDLSTQKGIAEWIVNSELRMNQCENKLNALQLYFQEKK